MTTKCTMILGDCLDIMQELPSPSMHMTFADLPYSVFGKSFTALKWDVPADVPRICSAIKKIMLKHGCMIFTANMALAAYLFMQMKKEFRYDLVHSKQIATGFLGTDTAPLRAHEHILLFASSKSTYNAQTRPAKRRRQDLLGTTESKCYRLIQSRTRRKSNVQQPRSVIDIKWEAERFRGKTRSIHPTQKPIGLLDWIIRTYSNPGDMVLDPVSGSATTAVAALMSGRNVTCIEKDEGYFEAGLERTRKVIIDNGLDVKLEVRR